MECIFKRVEGAGLFSLELTHPLNVGERVEVDGHGSGTFEIISKTYRAVWSDYVYVIVDMETGE